MPNERGPVGGAGELSERNVRHALIEVGYGLTSPPLLVDAVPKVTEILNAALAAKAPQGMPNALSLAVAIANTLMSQSMLDVTVQQAMFPIKRVLEAALAVPALPAPVSDDTIHQETVPPADEYNLRVSRVQGHWYVDIDIDKAHSGMANGFTLSEAMDSANEMLRHMRNTAIEDGRLPREAAALKPAPHQHTDACFGKVPETEGKGEYLRCGKVAGAPAPSATPTISELADEVNQCLQIILTNVGNLEDGLEDGRQERTAIEEAVDRAAKATWAALRGDSNGKP